MILDNHRVNTVLIETLFVYGRLATMLIVNFTEKLRRLTQGRNKAELARRVGLKATLLSDYVAKGYMPRADIALKIARAIEVPIDWLVDDSQDWPPPPVSAKAAFSTEELCRELGRRMLETGKKMFHKTELAYMINWENTTRELLELDVEKPLPKHLQTYVELPGQLNLLMSELHNFEPSSPIGDDVPEGSGILPDFEISLLSLAAHWRNLDDLPAYKVAAQLAGLWLIPVKYRPPWFAENIQHAREIARDELKKLTESNATKRSRKKKL